MENIKAHVYFKTRGTVFSNARDTVNRNVRLSVYFNTKGIRFAQVRETVMHKARNHERS